MYLTLYYSHLKLAVDFLRALSGSGFFPHVLTPEFSWQTQITWHYSLVKVKVGVLCLIQQPGPY